MNWPAQLTRASLPFFAIQPALNGEIAPDPVENVRHVDAILRHTDLRIPVLWLLGSDVTEGYVQMRIERLREPVQRVADRFKQLCGITPIAGDNVKKLERV